MAGYGAATWKAGAAGLTTANVTATAADVRVTTQCSADVGAMWGKVTYKIGTTAGGVFTEIATYTQQIPADGVQREVVNDFKNQPRGVAYTIKVNYTAQKLVGGVPDPKSFDFADRTITP